MELTYEDHYQTSVPLLRCDEALIETLEDHQVCVCVLLSAGTSDSEWR